MRLPILIIVSALLTHSAMAQRTLGYFLDAAHKNNPTGKLDTLQYLANRLSLEQERAALTAPKIGLDGGYLAAPVVSTDGGKTRFLLNPGRNTVDYYGADLALTNGGLYRGLVGLDQPLVTGPRARALEAQTQIQQEALAQHTRFTLHQLDKAISDQYTLCTYTLQQRDAIQELLTLVGSQSAISEKLASRALLFRADVQLLTIESERLQTTLRSLEAVYTARLLDLYGLCGISDTATVLLTPSGVTMTPDAGSLSGFTAAYRIDSAALLAGQQVFNLKYQPQLSVFTSAGLDASYAPDMARRFGLMAGLRYTQVLFDGRQKQINDRRVRLLSQTTAIQADYFETQNRQRKTRIRNQLQALVVQEADVKHQQTAYDTLLILYRQQVAAGQLSVINYLTVLRSRASLSQDLATIAYNRELLINEYNYWNW